MTVRTSREKKRVLCLLAACGAFISGSIGIRSCVILRWWSWFIGHTMLYFEKLNGVVVLEQNRISHIITAETFNGSFRTNAADNLIPRPIGEAGVTHSKFYHRFWWTVRLNALDLLYATSFCVSHGVHHVISFRKFTMYQHPQPKIKKYSKANLIWNFPQIFLQL